LAAGLLLVILAFPRTIHAFYLFPASPIAEAVQSRKNVSSKNLDFYSTRLKKTIAVLPTGLTHLRLAHIKDIEASRVGIETEKGKGLTREVVDLLKNGLALRPAAGYAWSRLALLDLSLGRKEGGIKALGMSHENTLYDKQLASSRLLIGLKLFPQLDESLRRKVASELLITFNANPRDVVRLAWHNQEILQAIKDILILSGNPERLDSFESMYDPFSRIAKE